MKLRARFRVEESRTPALFAITPCCVPRACFKAGKSEPTDVEAHQAILAQAEATGEINQVVGH